ncbi:PepSY domain-containing protein [Candidatus Acetatifactor stercoripullorum]|uniref:PepSY domain-containing protein n=1 Tax=Candidatus Acetatifactor stercoripullorum TaxID=2838414 RepID=UPI00298DB316|nr:PepSY domain-containing protein [Candidatus Acetatifactor stercoripullorum]
MKFLKKLFATPVRAIITCFCMLAVICIVGIAAAVSVITNSIERQAGLEASRSTQTVVAEQNTAANQSQPEQSTITSQTQGTDQSAADQAQTAAQSSTTNQAQSSTQSSTANQAQPSTQSAAANQAQSGSQTAGIGLEAAKEIALADAGLTAADVTFTKERYEREDFVYVYEIDFYTSTQEYDYEINADTGEIYSRSVESFQTGAQVNTGSGTNANHSYIGVDAAKSAALSHAGVSADSATFSKAKLDNDDGRMEYEIEFYAGGMEYDYTIDAFDGTILEYDSERWD